MTRLYVLLGRPVGHSVSPALHEAAFRDAGIDARYVALHAPRFEPAWSAVRRLEVAGGNVTVPWKEAAAAALDRPSPEATRARAANTFWRAPDGRLAGTETDGAGFLRALEESLGRGPAGLRVAVLGAGGAARAVLHALAGGGAAALLVWSRRPEVAAALAAELRGAGAQRVRALPAQDAGEEADLLVNATPASLSGVLPRPDVSGAYRGLALAVDLAYASEPTPFVRAMRAAGVPAEDGRRMLLHQAALAFEHWFERPAPLDAMRGALERSLAPG